MNKSIVLAKLKLQIAEIQEMIELIKETDPESPIIGMLDKQREATNSLIQTISDASFIPREAENLDIGIELRQIEKKVEIAKEGVEKIEKLEKVKQRIAKKIGDDNK